MDNIKNIMDTATHASLILYDIKTNKISIITKGGSDDIEIITMLEEAIYALGQKIADNQRTIRNN